MPAQSFGPGLQLVVIRVAKSASCRSCSSRLPAAHWRARQGGCGGSGGGKAREWGSCCLAQRGQTPKQKKHQQEHNQEHKKRTIKSTIRSPKKAAARAQSGAQNKRRQEHNQIHKKTAARAQSGGQKRAPGEAQQKPPRSPAVFVRFQLNESTRKCPKFEKHQQKHTIRSRNRSARK